MLSYQQRLDGCHNPVMKKLFKIIIEKKSNLCVAANYETIEECLKLVDKIGNHICMLKTQLNRYDGSTEENLRLLYEKKKKYNFLLFEDRKYNDTPETNASLYKKIVKYVDLVTVDAACGCETFEEFDRIAKEAGLQADEPRGSLIVCEFSIKGHEQPDPVKALNKAENNSFCTGIIAQKLNVKNPYSMFKATPGVHMSKSTDGVGQQWNHPSEVAAKGADVLIVGRGIVSASEDELENITIAYKEASYILTLLM